MSSPTSASEGDRYVSQLRAEAARQARNTAALMLTIAHVRDAVAAQYRRIAVRSSPVRAAYYEQRADHLELLAERARSLGAWEDANADLWNTMGK